MRRGRGKGKKQPAVASIEDPESVEDEILPAYRRRGRPTKPLKDEIEEEEEEEEAATKETGEDYEDAKDSTPGKGAKNQGTTDNGGKRKRPGLANPNRDSIKEENGIATKLSTSDSIKTVGFRQNGSRRKNKPRRAAEAVVECK